MSCTRTLQLRPVRWRSDIHLPDGFPKPTTEARIIMDTLEQWQAAGGAVEKEMMAFLLQFAPASEIKICDAQCIARFARKIAFDQFYPLRANCW